MLCGRVTDASPTIGCAAFYHNWNRDDYDKLAHAFVAGHFIECSTYVTGGNFSGFKALPGSSVDLAFPIVEISADGPFVVTMEKGKDGMVTTETCKAQLLYEIQGPMYYNPDVVAVLDDIKIEDGGLNRVYGIQFRLNDRLLTKGPAVSRMSRVSSRPRQRRSGSLRTAGSKQRSTTFSAGSISRRKLLC